MEARRKRAELKVPILLNIRVYIFILAIGCCRRKAQEEEEELHRYRRIQK